MTFPLKNCFFSFLLIVVHQFPSKFPLTFFPSIFRMISPLPQRITLRSLYPVFLSDLFPLFSIGESLSALTPFRLIPLPFPSPRQGRPSSSFLEACVGFPPPTGMILSCRKNGVYNCSYHLESFYALFHVGNRNTFFSFLFSLFYGFHSSQEDQSRQIFLPPPAMMTRPPSSYSF